MLIITARPLSPDPYPPRHLACRLLRLESDIESRKFVPKGLRNFLLQSKLFQPDLHGANADLVLSGKVWAELRSNQCCITAIQANKALIESGRIVQDSPPRHQYGLCEVVCVGLYSTVAPLQASAEVDRDI